MFVKFLKSKLHRATITDAKLNYAGSILIDSMLMKAANILPYESVLVADIDNGNRLQTYAVPAEADSGRVVILGAAARLIKTGDTVIIFSFAYCTNEEARTHKPKVIVLDEKNKIKTEDLNS
jgi:aspartate 1-decarboxylase